MPQLILLDYPNVTGEVLLTNYTGLAACTSIEMQTSAGEGTVGTPSFGDSGGKSSAPTQLMSAESETETGTPSSKTPSASTKRLGIDSLTVHRIADRATPAFLNLAFQARTDGTTATITIFRATEQGDSLAGTGTQYWHQPFMVMTLSDVHISSHSLTISGDSLDETFTISFKVLDITYTVYKNGQNVGQSTAHVDLTGSSSDSDS